MSVRFIYPTSCPECGSVELAEVDQTVICKDCEAYLQPRQVLSANEVYNLCAEYYALGLDQGKLEDRRKAIKAEVEQALTDWGAGKFEAEGFKAAFRDGRKTTDYRGIALRLAGAEAVKELEPEFSKIGKPYFQIDGPKV